GRCSTIELRQRACAPISGQVGPHLTARTHLTLPAFGTRVAYLRAYHFCVKTICHPIVAECRRSALREAVLLDSVVFPSAHPAPARGMSTDSHWLGRMLASRSHQTFVPATGAARVQGLNVCAPPIRSSHPCAPPSLE